MEIIAGSEKQFCMNQESPTPPNWAVRFLEWFCPDELLESILGDLLEQFESDQEVYSPQRARRKFVWNVLRFFHPSILLRNHLTVNLMTMGMLRSHLLVALRSMKKYKFYAAVNILGLSFAIGFVFLAFLFIQNELNVDQFHAQKDSIFRVYHKMVNTETGDVVTSSAVTAIPLARDLGEGAPFIRQYTRHASSSGTILVGNTPFSELITFVDPDFLTMFDFPLLQGDRHTALDQPGSVVLSEEKAKKFFGDKNPVGQMLSVEINDTTLSMSVSGVIDAQSEESSIQFGLLAPIEKYKVAISESVFGSYAYGLVENYILVDSELPRNEIEEQLTQIIQKFAPPDAHRIELGLQPLSKIHLQDQITGNAQFTSPRKLYVTIALALLVMIIAVINFIMLSTSHGLNRIREMGMRRALGALKRQLRSQLIVEALFVALMASGIGLLLAHTGVPIFARLLERPLNFSLTLPGIFFLLTLAVLTGLVTGLFQSVILVKYNAVQAIKGKQLFSGYNSWFNQGLIVIQFALSVLLIIGAINIREQMSYIQKKDLGFEEERLLEISMNSSDDREAAQLLLERFRSESTNNNRILSVSASMNNAREPWTELKFEQTDGTKESIFFNQVDPDYLQTMGIELLTGINFPEGAGSEFNGILVNEALVRHFGWKDPLSEQIPGKNFTGSHRILGVVKDFHFSSLHQRIEPLILALNAEKTIASGITGLSTYVWPPNLYQLEVRFSPGEIEPVLAHLKDAWRKVNPTKDFVYQFVDNVLENKYAEEKRWAKVVSLGSVFAILLAWIGLLGLMRLSVQKRTKEIGIRKTLGSSTMGIVLLLTRRFLGLVSLGIAIAWPIGWILVGQWLQSFNYRINLNPWWFLAAGTGVLLITLSSVGLQSIRAALSNPAEALKFD